MTSIETLAIGDELLTGKISDTNSAFVGERLFSRGLRLSRQTVIPDEKETILATLDEVSRRADFVICFGGLGPTSDDLTVDCVAEKMGSRPAVHPESEAKMREYYGARNRKVTEQSLRQVRIPSGAEPILNPVGMAPGFCVTFQSCRFYFLPGVPSEMRSMVDGAILDELADKVGAKQLHHHTWRCVGIAESDLQSHLQEFESGLPDGIWTGYRTVFPENHLTLYSRADLESEFLRLRKELGELLRPYAYTDKNLSLEEVVMQALQGRRLVTAESCTAGLIAQRLSRVPGASDVLFGGYVVYQNAAKGDLGVSLESPEEAVSAACTLALANRAQDRSGADVALAVTGYMGPGGGTDSTPEGTVFVAAVDGSKVSEKSFSVAYRPDRYLRQWATSTLALSILLKLLRPTEG